MTRGPGRGPGPGLGPRLREGRGWPAPSGVCRDSLSRWMAAKLTEAAGDTMRSPIARFMLALAAVENKGPLRAKVMEAWRGRGKVCGVSAARLSGTLTTWDQMSAPSPTLSNTSPTSSGCSCSRSERKLLLVWGLPASRPKQAVAARAAGLPVYSRLLAFWYRMFLPSPEHSVTMLGSASMVDSRRSRRALRPATMGAGGSTARPWPPMPGSMLLLLSCGSLLGMLSAGLRADISWC
ncbi:hypothetical protein V8C86DRAFT_2550952 [Haematococcus lacustris]